MTLDFLTDDAILATLGSRVAQHRINASHTQEAVATQAGLSKRTVERIEAGESVQLVSLIRTLRVLDLLDGIDQLIPEPKPRPIELLEHSGKERKRASSTRPDTTDAASTEWSWKEKL